MADIKNPNQAFNVFVASLIAEAAPTAAQEFIDGLKAANVFEDRKSYTRLKNKIKAIATMEIATAPDEDIRELTDEINNVGVYG